MDVIGLNRVVDDLAAVVVLLLHERVNEIEDSLAPERRKVVPPSHRHVHGGLRIVRRTTPVRDAAQARISGLSTGAAPAAAVAEAAQSLAAGRGEHLIRQ